MLPEERFFCSAQSRRNHELIFGTTPKVQSWLLLEYSDAWKPNAIRESTLPETLKESLGRLGKTARPQLIRQSHFRSSPITCFTVRTRESNSEIRRVCFADYDELSSLDLTALATHAGSLAIERPLFLVCTHGNHDKCCSKFGLPVYNALRELVGDDAWQCSHVGGDRFAANVLCFPHGIYYGHVSITDVKQIVEAQQRGEIYLKNYRGRCCYTRNVQVADYFVRHETGRNGIDDFRLVQAEPGLVRFQAEDGVHEIRFQSREAFTEILTCHSEEPMPVKQFDLLGHRIV